MRSGIKHTVMHNGIPRVTRGEENLHPWPRLLQYFRQLAPRHLRHYHVREEQVRLNSAFDDANGLPRTACLDNRVAELAQRFGTYRAHAVVILDDENKLRILTAGRARRFNCGDRRWFLAVVTGQVDSDRRANVGLRIDFHMTA